MVVGDDQEAGRRAARDLVDQVAEPADVRIVERGVDLVEHADRRRIGQEDGEQQRERGQRLLAAGQQRERLQALARRARHDLQAGLERVVGIDQREMGAAAAEQTGEQFAEMRVDRRERGLEPLAALAVEPRDRLAQLDDRGLQVGVLVAQFAKPLLDVVGFDLGAQVDRPDRVALSDEPRELRVDLLGVGQLGVLLDAGEPGEVGRRAVQALADRADDLVARRVALAQGTLAAAALLARLADRGLGLLEAAVAGGEPGFGLGDRVGRGLAFALGDSQTLEQRGALLGDRRRPVGQRLEFGGRPGAPFGELLESRLGALGAALPRRQFVGDRPQPLAPGLGLAVQTVVGAVALGEARASRGQLGALRVEIGATIDVGHHGVEIGLGVVA